jgi:hypothetical protein
MSSAIQTLKAFPPTTSSSSSYSKLILCLFSCLSLSSHPFISWTRSQVLARAHENVLASQKWLNGLYHVPEPVKGVDITVPLSYADRFRIRKPGVSWSAHPPHIDGTSSDACPML